MPLRTELESSRIRAVVNGELADPCEPDSLSGRGFMIVGPVNRRRVQSLQDSGVAFLELRLIKVPD